MAHEGSGDGAKPLAHISISSLEADVAYFDARIALLHGESGSTHKQAQILAYKELKRVLSEMLERLRDLPRVNP